MVAGSEDDRIEVPHVVRRERSTRREPYFDLHASVQMKARQAGRQRRCVVRNYDVAGPQQLDE
jgi:hypothetical protein